MKRRLLQINVTANWGSTGRIAEEIGRLAIDNGWESWIAHGRGKPKSASNLIRIGNDWDMRYHGVQTRLFDNHGLASVQVTKSFIKQVCEIKPDIIHLHNIHGYYLNYPLLFDYLKKWGGPVVWTLHDCWPFTGHCAYYDFVGCSLWRKGCHDCPQQRNYPSSMWRDRSRRNYEDKKFAFTGCADLTLVPVSKWLAGELSKSFLHKYDIVTIHNGIDMSVFKPDDKKAGGSKQKIILGVASVWERRKGLDEFLKLRDILSDDYSIILVGLTQKQIKSLPTGIIGIKRTENVGQLAKLYSDADVFVNPTLEDNFPTTNLEALACGTPVVTYATGGAPEAVDDTCGFVVDYGDVDGLRDKVIEICQNRPFGLDDCRNRAVYNFNKYDAFNKYLELYAAKLGKV